MDPKLGCALRMLCAGTSEGSSAFMVVHLEVARSILSSRRICGRFRASDPLVLWLTRYSDCPERSPETSKDRIALKGYVQLQPLLVVS
ncbi:hypothetical protein WJX79_007744 [Trebouxia sp. C0005]